MSGQARSPSLARDLFALGDIYLTIVWLAYQRLRHGPLWPWDAPQANPPPPDLTLIRGEEDAEAPAARRD